MPETEKIAKSTKKITTKNLAEMLGVQPDTVRRGYCVKGHYMGIIPCKLPNNRLLWPEAPALKMLEA